MKFSKYFCISIILLTQIMGKCCGPYEFFYLRGQYYVLGHPTLYIAQCSHANQGTPTKVTIFSQQWLCCGGGKRRPNKAAKIDVNALNVLSNILVSPSAIDEQELKQFFLHNGLKEELQRRF